MSPRRKTQAVSRRWLLAAATALVLCQPPGAARADDWTDCNGAVSNRIEAACSAIIGDTARPVPDRVKAYLNRARIYLNNAKFDQAFADGDAAMQLDANSVRALLTRDRKTPSEDK